MAINDRPPTEWLGNHSPGDPAPLPRPSAGPGSEPAPLDRVRDPSAGHGVGRRWLLPGLALLPSCAATIVPAGDPVVPASVEAGQLSMPDQARLPLRSWMPESGTPLRAVVLALHGFNDYRGAWTIPAPLLTAHGVGLYAYDQRGHGESVHPGYWSSGSAMATDAVVASRLIAARHPGVPLHLMGESMGAAVAILAATGSSAAGPPEVASIILLAPAVRGRATLTVVERTALSVALGTLPWFPLTGGSPMVRPSDNEEALRAMSRDPLVRKVTRVDFLGGLVDLMDEALEAAPRFSARSLILVAGRDDLVPDGATERFLGRLPPVPEGTRRVVHYPDGFHLLLRGRDRARVAAEILAWLGLSFPDRSSAQRGLASAPVLG